MARGATMAQANTALEDEPTAAGHANGETHERGYEAMR